MQRPLKRFADNIDSNIPHADGCFLLGISNKELNVRIGGRSACFKLAYELNTLWLPGSVIYCVEELLLNCGQ